MLIEAIQGKKFLESYAPSLSKVEFEKRILFIPNAKLVKLHRYTQSALALLECLQVQGLYANSLHTHALPEAVKLYLHGLASPTRTS